MSDSKKSDPSTTDFRDVSNDMKIWFNFYSFSLHCEKIKLVKTMQMSSTR
jgi:hypothetical protein